MACYEAASGNCADYPQPGTLALARAIDARYSEAIVLEGGYGILNCRPVSGGSGQPSVHGEGRAADIGFPEPAPHPQATALTAWLIEHQQGLGIQFIVYNRRKWGCSYQEWRPYTLTPHTDHVHVEQRWEKARDAFAVNTYLATLDAKEQEDDMPPLPVMVLIPWLPDYPIKDGTKVIGSRTPAVKAAVGADGQTRIVARGCRIAGGTWVNGRHVRVLGPLAQPICSLHVRKDGTRFFVEGVAGDFGTFGPWEVTAL